MVLTILFAAIYNDSRSGLILSLAITAGTTCYHFAMRLIVGGIYNRLMKNRADYRKPWYQVKAWEKKLYELLQVKKWKNKMPTYDPDTFNPRKHTWDEIAQAMCQSELVHETIVLLSFLPIAASKWFGSIGVFIITSIAAAALDMMFVIMQRYNRPRIIYRRRIK